MDENKKFNSGIVPPVDRSEPSWWFVFKENGLLIYEESSQYKLPRLIDFSELGLTTSREHYLGRFGNQPCYTTEVAEGTIPPSGMTFKGLRQIYGCLDEDLFWIAARAVQIVDWDRTHQFCGRCGVELRMKTTERAKECPQCGLLHFPRLAPAMIVLVEWGNKLLLARSRHFPSDMYSVIAGFVEPGESLEEAVLRELREEVGISVKDIKYFGSQSWPFPHSLMIGFTATYADGEISLDDSEIEDAGWFTADHLPRIPDKISIARKLIDWFLEKQGKLQDNDHV
jgi:NAD+ diphosphatase